MTMFEPHEAGGVSRRPNLSDVVAVSERGDGFSYMPGQVLARGGEAVDRLRQVAEPVAETELVTRVVSDREAERGERGWWIADNVRDVLTVVEVLLAEGYDAQPNHAFFAHGCGPTCPPHPALVYELIELGFVADPLRANPLRANPLRANPLRANPLRANPLRANHAMESTAVPAITRRFPSRTLVGPGTQPCVVVLDTGLAPIGVAAAAGIAATPNYSAPVLRAGMTGGGQRISGDRDVPDAGIALASGAVVPADGYLDPVAGHGTFIAGIIEQLAPGCRIDVRHVIRPLGDTDEVTIGDSIHQVVDEMVQGQLPPPVILNMSFGGQALGVPGYLREAVARAVANGIPVIASAGNDGLCTPQYPAAFPNVVAVAALGPDGPAPWTNYGDWVDACAPGTDLVSAFFDNFNGTFPSINSFDPDQFGGWAQWSGTSFAAPVVVAALARELVCGRDANGGDIDAITAVDRIVRAPHLARLPCLGTVVNI
jgi:hypothetical protein